MHLILFIAGLLGAASALLGAVGAHSLGLENQALISWTTAERYMMFHAVALIGLAILYDRHPKRWIVSSAVLLAVGTVLFSGSIFIMTGTELRWLWWLTPIGGVLLITGWVTLALGAIKNR